MKQIDHFIKTIDSEVGNRIYSARTISGLSQRELANAIGVSIQQLSKYEKGINKISIGRLILLATKLNKNLSDFYFNLTTNKENLPEFDRMNRSKIYSHISKIISKTKDEQQQKALLVLVNTVSKSFNKL